MSASKPKQVFHDAELRRWRRLRFLLAGAGIAIVSVFLYFAVTVFQDEKLPQLVFPELHHSYRSLNKHNPGRLRRELRRKRAKPNARAASGTGEGLRAAFYVTWDANSFASLEEYANQIDLLFPNWLYAITPDGRLQGLSSDNVLFDAVADGKTAPLDDKVLALLKSKRASAKVMPLVANYDPVQRKWLPSVGEFLDNPASRSRFVSDSVALLQSNPRYRGMSIDFEEIPLRSQPGFNALVKALHAELHKRGLGLYLNVPVDDKDFDYALLAANSDGLIVMDYDEHQTESGAGPISGQDWFVRNLRLMLKAVPKDKIVCAVGNYGYDWVSDRRGKVVSIGALSVQEAWLAAHESEADPEMDSDSLNPHFSYMESNRLRHDVWYMDAVTALNQMRGAEALGVTNFALWRLGAEDRSLWSVWNSPNDPDAPKRLERVPPGADVDIEGKGEILGVEALPAAGRRTLTVDPESGLITDEIFSAIPTPYRIGQHGLKKNQIAITFDDGPDPVFTPQILDVLKREHATATFFLIGLQTEKFLPIARRIVAEGHEIGNHTFTHPDISDIRSKYMSIELNLTERLFASALGVKPVLFRPPYAIDQEPDTAEEVRPLEVVQKLGYTTVGSKIDPNDWRDHPRQSADELVARVIQQLPQGNILLLHDGGGDRTQTVKALPLIIEEVRARGYEIVPVSALVGKTREEVMPSISKRERWSARIDWFAFWVFGVVQNGIVFVFFIGNILISARLLFIGALAIFDRLRNAPPRRPADWPALAVLVPAYNEEKVIERTVRAILASDYPKLRVIVVDDGSSDGTLAVARGRFEREIREGKVLVLTHANAGKAQALNLGLSSVAEEFFVGIDADTAVEPDAFRHLVQHFDDPAVASVAGNIKVANRMNLWTNWQALEYITSQNFERRAFDVLGTVSVVPGALGAWRTSAVREVGGYHHSTVAEDADLTMSLLERGWRVLYDDRAIAFTEAPVNADALMRQRFRWSFGILQAAWKHGRAMFRKSRLGWIALPNILVFQILLPLVSPFIDFMFVVGVLAYLLDRSYHPDSSNPASLMRLLTFFMAFMFIDFLAAALAFSLERRRPGQKEDYWLLWHTWLQRFVYRQLFSVVMFKTLARAVQGKAFSWDKLERLDQPSAAPSETGSVIQS